jgi:hypothetical protein
MAKGEQRGNREAKKPKKDKTKVAASASPFEAMRAKPAPQVPTKKK